MYDYTLQVKINGVTKSVGYQTFITKIGIQNEVVHGRPLSDGGTPQAQTVAKLVKDTLKADSVLVLFHGQPILSA
jgi:hypothetical protein